MTGSTTTTCTEGPSHNLETKCGWKGILKSVISINSNWNTDDDNHHGTTNSNAETPKDSSSHTTCSSSVNSAALNTTSIGHEELEPSQHSTSLHDVSLYWMGGEPSKYNDNMEQRGVMSILKALSETERDEIKSFDMTVPIRHLRAEKVCIIPHWHV
jgi:hypothetical protein